MTDFSDLRAAYSKLVEAESAYWDDIFKRTVDFSEGFARYLRPDPAYFRDKGIVTYYVELGKFSLGTFEPVSNPVELGYEDTTIELALRVHVDDEPGSRNRLSFTFQIELQKSDGFYELTFRGDAKPRTVKVAASTDLGSHTDLFEEMAAEIVGFMSTDKFE